VVFLRKRALQKKTAKRQDAHSVKAGKMMSKTTESLVDHMPTPFLESIARKISSKQRVTYEEGVKLLETESDEELEAIRQLADAIRCEKVGETVHFASCLFIYPTNLCELNCQFCSFYAKPGWEKAWFHSPAQIEEKIRQHLNDNLTEIHIVGGLWRDCDLDYYEELFTRIKKIDPNLHIKALTPVEYHFLAEKHRLSVKEVLQKMMEWGLGSLPGGGAEILVEEIRTKIAPGKISSDTFLAIHDQAHRLGLRSNITMLFGHIETNEHIATHLCKVRQQQDQTGGFKAFIPLKFGQENNTLGKRKKQLKEKNVPLIYAVSRLMLDNVQHLKVMWNYVGVELALKLLNWGGNDLSSTNTEEKVIAMAGAPPVIMNQATMNEIIMKLGRIPRLTHSGAV
jgi:CofH subfamily radical SAM domain protein